MTVDQQLMMLVAQGDTGAFECLVKRYKDFIFNIARMRLEDYHLAEEATQDAFVKIYRYASSYRGDCAVQTWLFRIAERCAYDQIRKQSRHRHSQLDQNVTYSSIRNQAEEFLESNDQMMLIDKMLGALDERSREVVQLFYLKELKIEEVAELMGLKTSNVKILLFRARKKLSHYFNEGERLTKAE